MLDPKGVAHSRKVYALFDILGDLGGVIEVIMIVFGFIFFPISEHSYIIRASKKLFYARTQDENLFRKRKESKIA